MDRTTPTAHKENIDLYMRTYYSLLRSSEPIRVRSLEDTHVGMDSSLHQQAASPDLDISALLYAALRLPSCIPQTNLIVMGQMEDVFRRGGYNIADWEPVRAKARRRKFHFDAATGSLAAYIASVSDIDDLIPCLTAFQIEWNKMHQKLVSRELHHLLKQVADVDGNALTALLETVRRALGLSIEDFAKLEQIWAGQQLLSNLQQVARQRLDLRLTTLGSGLSDYRRSVQFWWRAIELAAQGLGLTERPIYFVSSNVHGLVNLVSGAVKELEADIIKYVERENPEGIWDEYQKIERGDDAERSNFFYYALRFYAAQPGKAEEIAQKLATYETEAGITRINEPHCLDVETQIFELNKLNSQRLDARLQIFSEDEQALLQQSDALLFNIDYPLGMAAYHIFSQVCDSVGPLLGVYILGKAATLNGRVGDVMIPNVVYDEHSHNSYLFRNCFSAQDVASSLKHGSVFDNQKAVTVHGTFLQTRRFMHIFYEEGYTDIEMEAGPYLSGVYENIYPQRYPSNEIVNLFINAPYDLGLIHYASDTPISKRQTLLSKGMSYFGVDGTYATSIAVLRRVLEQEIKRQSAMKR